MACKFDRIKYLLRLNIKYFNRPPWDSGIPVPELIDFLAKNNAGCALDLGCGTGTNMTAFLEAGWEVIGVDIAYLAIRKARNKIEKYGNRGRVFLRDVTRLDFIEKQFDLIYDIGCYHALNTDDRKLYQENISRLLKKNGSFILYGFWMPAEGKFGISYADHAAFSRDMMSVTRLDGLDHGKQASVFLTYKK